MLKDCGLITDRPQGRSIYYRLTQPHDLTTLLGAAEQLLGAIKQPAARSIQPTPATAVREK